MELNQFTIQKPISFSGIGLHSGEKVNMTFKPAPPDTGIIFVRVDLEGKPEIPALIDYVKDVSRGTTIGIKNAVVMTVEHVLAAIAGMEIDNLYIELDAPEAPVGDGSSLPIVKVLQEAGVKKQDALKEFLEIEKPIFYTDPDNDVDIVVTPADDFRITFLISYVDFPEMTQYTSMVSKRDEFIDEYASSRTFCFLSEIEALKEHGLIKGGNLDNALVVVDKPMSDENIEKLKKMFDLDRDVFLGENRLLNGTELRYTNEFVRHKTLDLIGDLFLLGVPVKGHFLAARSGHASNVELVKKIRKLYEKKKVLEKFQKTKKSFVFDIEEILSFMPHRYPFLLVDRILEMNLNQDITGLKNVTFNEPFFPGHFPGKPVMPGILQIEAMAQVGGILLLNNMENPRDYILYFTAIDNAKFRKKVVPGDQIIFKIELQRFRRGFAKMHGKGYVDGEVAVEADMSAYLTKVDEA